ncbi:MAG TPA: efflux RND transporter periplasmic adaptor subunit [Burkholderiaceae bacterium]|nr:efflux RND transporter periplasmic adaptor subunit [Burkholderiaceae bacterium]
MNDSPSPVLPGSGAARSVWRRRWPLAVLLVALAIGAAVWIFRRPAESLTPPGGRGGRGAEVVPVAVASVTKQDIQVTINALGTVTPLATVTVQAQASGQIIQVPFVEGQSVRKGDLLVQIDPRPYEAALAQAEGQLAKDKAALEEARMDLVRYEELVQKKSINRQQAEDQKWIVQQNEGAVHVDQAQVDMARINLGYCRIVSPTDGRIGLRLVDPGNIVQAGSGSTANLAVITRMRPMTVIFALPEDNLPAVYARQHGGAKLPVQAYDRSGAHLLDTGTLLAIDSQINTSTGTVNLKAQFPNERENLFPNQFVNVVLRTDVLTDAVAVPSAAIQRGAKGTYTYVVKADKTVAMTPVKLGATDGTLVAALSGLTPGDRVVVDGADKLRDGATVSIPAEK